MRRTSILRSKILAPGGFTPPGAAFIRGPRRPCRRGLCHGHHHRRHGVKDGEFFPVLLTTKHKNRFPRRHARRGKLFSVRKCGEGGTPSLRAADWFSPKGPVLWGNVCPGGMYSSRGFFLWGCSSGQNPMLRAYFTFPQRRDKMEKERRRGPSPRRKGLCGISEGGKAV